MKMLSRVLLVSAMIVTRPAQASNAAEGKLIAMSRCAPCHVVEKDIARNEIAVSPPFDVISAKFKRNLNALVGVILAPHSKMNMTISPREAENVAAYIATLSK